MKKLNYFVIALFAVSLLFAISCKDDEEDPVLDSPGVIAPTGTTVMVSEVVSMDFGISAPGKVAEVTVAASEGTAVIVDATSIVGQTSGTVTVTYTAPDSEGTKTVTLTVKDQQSTPKTTSGVADVEVTTLDAPSITAPTG
ncbi:MAG: hypothetical protein KAQ62_28960, partial [Cyclobacteriaceae bacterium]|nr:hypothetical protein [Cyclobacteriaceae bacterium]